MHRVKRVDYGRGCDFWLPCLSQLERYWASVLTTPNPMTGLPSAAIKSVVDASFLIQYGDNSDRLYKFLDIMQAQTQTLVIGEQSVEFYIVLEPYALNISLAILIDGVTNPCEYDCMAWTYGGMDGDNPL